MKNLWSSCRVTGLYLPTIANLTLIPIMVLINAEFGD